MTPTVAAPGPASVTDPASGPCSLRERKKQQTRQAIHDAALRLVADAGLGGVTVEQICAEADVSPRTFFNYFPSKADAALGFPPNSVPATVRTRFLTSSGALVSDVCDLVAHTVALPQDRARARDLVHRHPEVMPTMLDWMAVTRRAVIEVAAERTDEQTARTAVTLVMGALIELAQRTTVADGDELTERLREIVTEMGAMTRV
ncbi:MULTISPECIES: TetR/AcrR family transcriptional regulator [unclassified Curtobacterium]|uniref:TetR/AcrR family transcriptional regulator n=1 Tax=unclassified Curtobacterium TaxID=257496 RepID=UPI0037FBE764